MSEEALGLPPAHLRYRRPIRPIAMTKELWRARQLILTLAEREMRVKYKQALLGIGWAVMVPVILMVVFTMFVRRVVTIDTHGVPYLIFTYVGLLPWTFFANSLSRGGQSLLINQNLLNKVYCPREVFPIASVAVAGVDTLIATVILGVLFVVNDFAPKGTSVWIPLLLLIQLAFTLGITLLVSSATVYLRDLRHALPMILQLGLFATPVAYPIDVDWAELYAAINPIAPVIEGYRKTVLYGTPPTGRSLLIAGVVSIAYLVIGYATFKRLETRFADVA